MPGASHSSVESYREIKRANSSSDFGRFADCLDGNVRRRQEFRCSCRTRNSCSTFLRLQAAIYAPAEKTEKERKRGVIAPGKSRESQILPSGRETTSGRRETSLITTGFGIEFHPPSRGEYLLPRRVPHV